MIPQLECFGRSENACDSTRSFRDANIQHPVTADGIIPVRGVEDSQPSILTSSPTRPKQETAYIAATCSRLIGVNDEHVDIVHTTGWILVECEEVWPLVRFLSDLCWVSLPSQCLL